MTLSRAPRERSVFGSQRASTSGPHTALHGSTSKLVSSYIEIFYAVGCLFSILLDSTKQKWRRLLWHYNVDLYLMAYVSLLPYVKCCYDKRLVITVRYLRFQKERVVGTWSRCASKGGLQNLFVSTIDSYFLKRSYGILLSCCASHQATCCNLYKQTIRFNALGRRAVKRISALQCNLV